LAGDFKTVTGGAEGIDRNLDLLFANLELQILHNFLSEQFRGNFNHE
jgi:hypothetical protein